MPVYNTGGETEHSFSSGRQLIHSQLQSSDEWISSAANLQSLCRTCYLSSLAWLQLLCICKLLCNHLSSSFRDYLTEWISHLFSLMLTFFCNGGSCCCSPSYAHYICMCKDNNINYYRRTQWSSFDGSHSDDLWTGDVIRLKKTACNLSVRIER